MTTVDVGFIGAGSRAQAHYRSLSDVNDATIAAVCDIDEDRREETADRYGVDGRYGDYEAMLDDRDLDAVYAVMSPSLLDPIVTTLLERGQHVFVEKPPGTTAEQTRRWADLAERNGCHTCVGFQRRFHPLVVRARERVAERGDVSYALATFHKDQLDPTRNQLRDDVIHVVDLLCWMGGGVDAVHGFHTQGVADPSEFDQFHANQFVAVLEFSNAGVGVLNANRAAGGRDLEFEMHGRRISAYAGIHGSADLDELVVQADGAGYGDADRIPVTDVVESTTPDTRVDGTDQINRHFVDSVARNRTPDVTFAETVESMEVVEAITEGERLPTHFDERR